MSTVSTVSTVSTQSSVKSSKKSVEFIDWLREQTHRTGDIGRLARFAASDPAWQKASFKDVFCRLILTLAAEHLRGLQQAYADYRKTRESQRA